MGEANQTRVGIVERTSFQTPAPRDLLLLPLRSQSMKGNVRKTQSQTLRLDANIGDVIKLAQDSGGGLTLEFVFPFENEALWYLLRAAMRTTESAARSEAGCLLTPGAKTITKAGADFTAGAPVLVNDVVRVSGAPAASDNGYFRVTAVAPTTVTVARDSNFTGGADLVSLVRGARMQNGIEKHWLDVEVARMDVQLFQLFQQTVVNGFDLRIAEDILTMSVALLGAPSQEATVTYATSITPPTNSAVLDHLGIPDIRFGDTQSTSKALALTLANNIVLNTRVGNVGIEGATWGSMEIRTRWSGYQSTWQEMQDHVANNAKAIWWVMQDSGGRAVSFLLPDHKWLDLENPTRGLNQVDYVDGNGQSVALNQAHSLRMQRWV